MYPLIWSTILELIGKTYATNACHLFKILYGYQFIGAPYSFNLNHVYHSFYLLLFFFVDHSFYHINAKLKILILHLFTIQGIKLSFP